jgi:CcmD family protein
MFLTRLPLLLAQISIEDLQLEHQRLQHDYQFLSYGLTAAWVITVIYVLMMIGRQKKLKQEIAGLRAMLEEKQHRT